MDAKEILAAKVAYLTGNSDDDIDEAMKQMVEQDKALAQEIAFVEAFYDRSDELPEEQPSSNLDARFYQMLSMAQAAQNKVEVKEPGLWQKISDWLTPKPALQFAMMAGVFSLGYFFNSPAPVKQNGAIDDLQKEVQSLSSLVALSMIDNQSASTRLTGINYSKQSDAKDETLNNALLKMIATDSSTAVRLAAIDAFKARGINADIELTLLNGMSKQNLMVQINLVELLINQGTTISRIKLKEMAKANQLNLEVKEFFEQHRGAVKTQNDSI